MIPTSIDGTDITGATIDGTDVTEITVDGNTVFTAGPAPGNFQFDAQDLNLANGDPVTSWSDTLGRDTLTNGQNLVYDTSTMNDASVRSTSDQGVIESTNSTLLNIFGNSQDITFSYTFEFTNTPADNSRHFSFETNDFWGILTGNKFQPDGSFKYFLQDGSGSSEYLVNTDINDNQPHFIVISQSGGGVGGVEIYLDDMTTQAGSVNANNGDSRFNISGITKLLLFSRFAGGGAGVEASIGFWRLDDKILTQAERQAIKDSRPEL
jgi:hypothetical protein